MTVLYLWREFLYQAVFQHKDHLSRYNITIIDININIKMVMRPPYLYNENPYTCKMVPGSHFNIKTVFPGIGVII